MYRYSRRSIGFESDFDFWLKKLEPLDNLVKLRLVDAHQNYLKNGGTIKCHFRYGYILRAISIEMINEILMRGARIKIPYFGELYVEEQQVLKSRNPRVIRNNKLKPVIVFKTFYHTSSYMKLYSTLNFYEKKESRLLSYLLNKTRHYKKNFIKERALFYNINRAKKRSKVYYYKKLLKKKK